MSGGLSQKDAFNDETGEKIALPLLIVTNFVRRDEIALRAFEISKSHEAASPEANWLRAEDELLGLV